MGGSESLTRVRAGRQAAASGLASTERARRYHSPALGWITGRVTAWRSAGPCNPVRAYVVAPHVLPPSASPRRR